jgi:hypothetical protein
VTNIAYRKQVVQLKLERFKTIGAEYLQSTANRGGKSA